MSTIVLGDASRPVSAALESRELEGLRLEPLDLPPQSRAAAAPDAELTRALAAARAAYIDGEPGRCLEALADSDVDRMLAARRRGAVARLLLWRAACQLSSMNAERARVLAREIAVFALDPPEDLDGPISPDVAEMLVAEMDVVRGEPAAELRVVGDYAHARVRLDGGESVCEPPCGFDVPPGDHVVSLRADGLAPASRRVRVGAEGASVRFDAEAADPATAASQWNRRYRGTPGVESVASLRLLAMALRRPHLAVLLTERRGDAVQIRAAFVEDRGLERRSSVLAAGGQHVDDAVGTLLADLLVDHLPPPPTPLWEEPAFWIISGVAVLSAIAALVAVSQLDTPTNVRFVP